MLAPVLSSLKLNVFDIDRHGSVVRIILDRDDDLVSIDDCTEASRFLSHALDVEDIIPGRYRLEVSSPGLDRPLTRIEDFHRFDGRLCRINVTEPVAGNYRLVGKIAKVDGNQITLAMPDGTTCAVDYDNVAKARLEIEF